MEGGGKEGWFVEKDGLALAVYDSLYYTLMQGNNETYWYVVKMWKKSLDGNNLMGFHFLFLGV